MTQDTAHMPLDERGLIAAAVAVHHASDEADATELAEDAIRAYLQTAAADVSGLVARLNAIDEAAMYEAPATTEATIAEAASTLQTLSARNAALEAENERLREFASSFHVSVNDASFYKDVSLHLIAPHALSLRLGNDSSKSWLFSDLESRRVAALSAPKGGQDHG